MVRLSCAWRASGCEQVYCADSIACTLHNCTVTVHRDTSAFLTRRETHQLNSRRSPVPSSVSAPKQEGSPSVHTGEDPGCSSRARGPLAFSHRILPPVTASLDYYFASPPYLFLSNCVRNYRRAVAERTLCHRAQLGLDKRRGGRSASLCRGSMQLAPKRTCAPPQGDYREGPNLEPQFPEPERACDSSCTDVWQPWSGESPSSFLVRPAQLVLTPSLLSAAAVPLFFPEPRDYSPQHLPSPDGESRNDAGNARTRSHTPGSALASPENATFSSPLSPPLHTVLISLSPVDLRIRTWDIQHLQAAVSLMLTDKKTHRMLVVAAMKQGLQTHQTEEVTVSPRDASRIARGAGSVSIDSTAFSQAHQSQWGAQDGDAPGHPSGTPQGKATAAVHGVLLDPPLHSTETLANNKSFRMYDETSEKASTTSGCRGRLAPRVAALEQTSCAGQSELCLPWTQQPRDDGPYQDRRVTAALESLAAPQGYPNIMAWNGVWATGMGDWPHGDTISKATRVVGVFACGARWVE